MSFFADSQSSSKTPRRTRTLAELNDDAHCFYVSMEEYDMLASFDKNYIGSMFKRPQVYLFFSGRSIRVFYD
jgi:hypothetical protein